MSLTDIDRQHLRRAIELAEEHSGNGEGGPFGAVITRDGVIVGEGSNEVTSTNDPTAHAEVVAIRRACIRLDTFSLSGCVIYSSCEPCPMCLAAIYWARLDRLVFAATRDDAAVIGFDDAFLYDEIVRPPTARKIPVDQALDGEARRVMEAWLAMPGRIPY